MILLYTGHVGWRGERHNHNRGTIKDSQTSTTVTRRWRSLSLLQLLFWRPPMHSRRLCCRQPLCTYRLSGFIARPFPRISLYSLPIDSIFAILVSSIHASSTSLGMAADESGSKRKRALKVEILVFERQ